MKLTTEQSQVVAENEHLIYGYLKLRDLDKEDWYGLFAIELCIAVCVHEPEKGALSTLFYRRCDNKVADEYVKLGRIKRTHNGIVSIDELHECIPDSSYEDEVDLDWVDEDVREIVDMKVKGYTQVEIAESFGVTQPYISKVLRKFKKELESR